MESRGVRVSKLPRLASPDADDLILIFDASDEYSSRAVRRGDLVDGSVGSGSDIAVAVTSIGVTAVAKITIVTSAVTILLPTTGGLGAIRTIKATVPSVVVSGNGRTIDGASSITLAQYESIDLVNDGTNWWII